MERYDQLRFRAPRWASEPTAEHVAGRPGRSGQQRTVTLQLAPRTDLSPVPAQPHPTQQAAEPFDDGSLMLILAAFIGAAAFVLGGLIASNAGTAYPAEPLVTEPAEPVVVAPPVPTSAAPPPLTAQSDSAADDERDEDDRDDEDDEQDDEEERGERGRKRRGD